MKTRTLLLIYIQNDFLPGGTLPVPEGDTIVPKLGNLKVFASPAETAKVTTTLSKGDEMIYMGEETNGFLKIEAGAGAGWVKKVLVSK